MLRVRARLAPSARTVWPTDSSATGTDEPRVGIVVVTFNTRRLIAQLLFSLYRLLGRNEFAQLVVVDNASTDGSRELLDALHEARLIDLIRNRHQRYHGPALTQASRGSRVASTRSLQTNGSTTSGCSTQT
jgi:Glycosyl transferase family 2